MNYNPNRDKSSGRFAAGVKQASLAHLTVVDSVHSTEPDSRAAALMDPDCQIQDLEHAARNDQNTTVRLTAVAFVPDAGLEDRNPLVRALAQDLSGISHDSETSRVMELLAA